uniref:hypothetical protein n=1 Tax=Megamonas funiformis TaxID=437897 RepID=UPI002676867B
SPTGKISIKAVNIILKINISLIFNKKRNPITWAICIVIGFLSFRNMLFLVFLQVAIVTQIKSK